MIFYVIRRLLMVAPVMAVVTIVVFLLSRLGPADPAAILVGDLGSSEEIQRTRIALGLDRPLLAQYLTWITGVLRGDLGISIFTRTSVASLIGQSAEPTIVLTLATMIYTVIIAVPLGVLAAWRAGSAIDRIFMGLAVLGFSTPVFVLGYVLAYVFGNRLGILPVQGYRGIEGGIGGVLASITLPCIAIGSTFIALIARVTRASMLDVLGEDYIRTAHAKGMRVPVVLLIHALKNAAIPIVTMIGIGFGVLLSGVVVTESVFAIPGIGRLTVESVFRRDFPVIQGIVLAMSLVYVLLNLVIDLAYTLLDPRIRY